MKQNDENGEHEDNSERSEHEEENEEEKKEEKFVLRREIGLWAGVTFYVGSMIGKKRSLEYAVDRL